MNKVTNGKYSTALFQFLLQSYSAGFNYANRNSSSEQVKCLDQAYIFIYELIVWSNSSIIFFLKCLFSNLEPSLCFCTYLPAPGVQHFSEAASVDHWYSLLYNMCRGVCILIMEIVTVMPQVNFWFFSHCYFVSSVSGPPSDFYQQTRFTKLSSADFL